MCIKGDCPSGAESFARYAFLTEQGYIDFYAEYFSSLLKDCKPLIRNKDDNFSYGTDRQPDNGEKLAQIIQDQMGCNGVDKEYIKKRIDECTHDDSWDGVWDNSGRPSSLDDFTIGS